MKKLVAFDFDGVLCDSLGAVLRKSNSVARSIGGSTVVTAEALSVLPYLSFTEVGRIASVPATKYADFERAVVSELMHEADNLQLFSGISTLLEELHTYASLSVVSANYTDIIETVLKNAGVFQLFDSILGADTEGRKEEKLRSLVRRDGFSKERTWMVGDTISDAIAGKSAGVHTLAVTWGWQTREVLKQQHPRKIVDTPAEALAYLKEAILSLDGKSLP